MTGYYPALLIPLEWRPISGSLLSHLKSEDRDLLRHPESWSKTEVISRLSAVDETLCFRISIYEKLNISLAAMSAVLPNYDQVRGEIDKNRVACLLIRLFILLRLQQFGFACGIAKRILYSPASVSLNSDETALLQNSFGNLLISLDPSLAVEFSGQLASKAPNHISGQLRFLSSFVSICYELNTNQPQIALQQVEALRKQDPSSLGSREESALYYTEALCHNLLDHPAEEFRAYKQWRSCQMGGIGQAIVEAKSSRAEARVQALLAGADRLWQLAESDRDQATISALKDDQYRHRYQLPSATRTSVNAADEDFDSGDSWQLFTLSTISGKPIRRALTEIVSSRRSRLALVSIEVTYLGIQPRPFPKSGSEGDLPNRFVSALNRVLDHAKDTSTRVNLLPQPDPKGNRWIVCTRDSEDLSLGIRLSDFGENFKAQTLPVLMLPLNLPDDAWLKKAEDAIGALVSSGSLWQGDFDNAIDNAVRSLTPSLAPLERSRGSIRDLE